MLALTTVMLVHVELRNVKACTNVSAGSVVYLLVAAAASVAFA